MSKKDTKTDSTWCAPVASAPTKPVVSRGSSLRKAGEQIIGVLRERGRRLMCSQFYRALPDVPKTTIRCRLTQMSERGDISRFGSPKAYEYGLSSTWVTT